MVSTQSQAATRSLPVCYCCDIFRYPMNVVFARVKALFSPLTALIQNRDPNIAIPNLILTIKKTTDGSKPFLARNFLISYLT